MTERGGVRGVRAPGRPCIGQLGRHGRLWIPDRPGRLKASEHVADTLRRRRSRSRSRPVRRPAHRARSRRDRSPVGRRRGRQPGRAGRRRRPGVDPIGLPAGPPGRRVRGPGVGRTAAAGRQEHAEGGDDRARLPPDRDPRGDQAERPGESGLVHRVHALPAGDQPGSARGVAQLPDGGRGPDRSGHRQRLDARRGHRRCRGDGDGPPHVAVEVPAIRRRRRHAAADHRGDPDSRRTTRHRGAGRRAVRRLADR